MEQTNQFVTRRGFLQTSAAMVAAASAGSASGLTQDHQSRAGKSPKPRKNGRIRVGALSWCFHSFSAGADPTEALDILGQIGFEGTEMIINAPQDIRDFWTDAKIDSIRKRLEANKLALAQFVLFQPVVEGLTSLNADERNRNLDNFEAGCRIGKKLGAPMINIVSPWARELHSPGNGYLPRYYEASGNEKYHIDIDPGFDWDAVWENYIEVTRQCLQRTKAHDLKFTIEHHTHTIIPDAVSFLRLWDAVRDPDLGYNMDVGWTLLQREYPPVAIHKVGNKLMNLHMRDIDANMRQFVHVGTGAMDFTAIIEALKAIGFDGFVNIEQDKFPGDMMATCTRYLQIMKECIGG
ncbi:MAG: sugar phosphate isomerase/epimerase [Phycisphaerae bacterium]|nr:sugar phosphate isomerase/epimerase [Phycisphaerae bacterium]